MRLLDDLRVPESEQQATRRRFLGGVMLTSLGVSLAGTLAVWVRYLWPSVLFELPTRFRAARIGDLVRKRILFLRDRKLFVVKDEEGIFAQSAVCPHLGCLARANPAEDGFFCPCHGSQFSIDGRVIKGPAPKALAHYQIERRQEDLWGDVAREEETDARLLV